MLNREPGLQLSVVLDESVLKRRVGTDQVMYDQLQRLAREADRPNVTLQILPLDAQHTVFGESFVIFRFGPDYDAMLQDVVSAEHLRTASPSRARGRPTCTGSRFRCSRRLARPGTSKELILETAQSHWADGQTEP